jgi:hypothetical protein
MGEHGPSKLSINQQVLAITPAYSDRRVAELLAAKCLELTERPFRFAINHDIRPPKNLACPLHFDWAKKDRVGVEMLDKERMRKWLVSAALKGYTIQYVGADKEMLGFPHSMAIARRRAENHQAAEARKASGYVDNGDDIPF